MPDLSYASCSTSHSQTRRTILMPAGLAAQSPQCIAALGKHFPNFALAFADASEVP